MFSSLVRQIRPTLKEITFKKFISAKEWVIKSVYEHDFCRDLNSHSKSKYLGGVDGTMFGFMGFESGSDPVDELLNFLENSIEYSEGNAQNGKLFSARVSIPSISDIVSESSLYPYWIPIGWPILAENGVSGLSNYLNKYWAKSVSEEGFQTKAPIRSASFSGVPFLRPIFSEFRKRLLIS